MIINNLAVSSLTPRGAVWSSPAQVCRALLAVSLLFVQSAFTSDIKAGASVFSVEQIESNPIVVNDLLLHGSSINGIHRVCPQLTNTGHQPFCRKFDSPMLDACGYGDMIFLVLANGEIHLVNNALIGVNGGFDADFHPDRQLKLELIWIPDKSCRLESGLPQMLAMDRQGLVMHFNGKNWRPLDFDSSTSK